eukprot:2007337-Amphidinium_carterae.2
MSMVSAWFTGGPSGYRGASYTNALAILDNWAGYRPRVVLGRPPSQALASAALIPADGAGLSPPCSSNMTLWQCKKPLCC